MQIQNNSSVTPNIMASSSQPNVGDVLQVTVKERVNTQDAVVAMKGTTSTVTFEGELPKQDKVLVEVIGKTAEGNYTVKVSDRQVATSASQQTIPQSTDSSVSEAVKAFTSRGMTVTKENVASVKEFLTNGKGSIEQKMDTLRMMAQKQISISDTTLKSVHEALNGKPLSSTLASVLDELGVDFQPSRSAAATAEKSLSTVRTEVQREPDLAKAIKIVEDFLKNTSLNEASKKTLDNSVSQAKSLTQAGQTVNAKVQLVQNLVVVEKQTATSNMSESTTNSGSSKSPSEVVRNVIGKVAQEPDLAKALDQVKEAVKTENLPTKVVEQLEKAIQDTAKLQQAGQTVQARANLTNALNQIEQQAQTEEAQPSEVIRQVKEKVAQEPNLAKALDQVKEAVKTATLPTKVVEQLEKAIQDTVKLQQVGQTVQARANLTNALNQMEQQAQTEEAQPSEVIRQVKEKVAQEPNLAKALDQVKEAVKTAPLPTKVVEQLEKAVQETVKLQQAGQTVQARANLTNALNEIEQQAQTEEAKPSEVIRQVKEKVAQEPNLAKALDQVKEAVKTAPLANESSGTTRKSGSRHGQTPTSGSNSTSASELNERP